MRVFLTINTKYTTLFVGELYPPVIVSLLGLE